MSNKLVLSAVAIASIAMICHEANAAYCRSLGDDSQVRWDDAPEWQRASAINGVEFHLANPDAGEAASHENWLKGKEADGWKYGEVKDEAAKTHPCMVPFDQLPREQQFKDANFRAIVHAATPVLADLESAGRQLEPAGLNILYEPVVTAFNRLGIEINDKLDADVFVIKLDGVADRLEAQVIEIEDLKSSKTKAEKRARVAEAALPDKPRAIGRPKLKKGQDEAPRLTPAELRELLEDAETVEIVFSDGGREIAGLAPRSISGDAWVNVPAGLKLNVHDLTVHGPGLGSTQSSFALQGYGLLIDGELVAWSERPAGQLTIGTGSTFQLKDDVIF